MASTAIGHIFTACSLRSQDIGPGDKGRTLFGTRRTLLARLCSLLALPPELGALAQTALRQQAQQLLVRIRCEVYKMLSAVNERLRSL
jgi:hypothetical protein